MLLQQQIFLQLLCKLHADFPGIAAHKLGTHIHQLYRGQRYHDFGVEKAKHVGVNQQMFEAPDEKQLELLKEVYRSKKIDVVE